MYDSEDAGPSQATPATALRDSPALSSPWPPLLSSHPLPFLTAGLGPWDFRPHNCSLRGWGLACRSPSLPAPGPCPLLCRTCSSSLPAPGHRPPKVPADGNNLTGKITLLTH